MPPTPSLPLSLRELRARARAPEAEKADIDALLVALLRPVWPGENRAQRAEVLALILEDPWLGGFTGSDGRRVDGAAAQALVALGEPYASTLSEEGREALRNAPAVTVLEEPEAPLESEPEEAPERAVPASMRQTLRYGLALIALVYAGYECTVLSPQMESGAKSSIGFFPLFSFFTCGIPAATFLLKPGPRTGFAHSLGLSLTTVAVPLTLCFCGFGVVIRGGEALYYGGQAMLISRIVLSICLRIAKPAEVETSKTETVAAGSKRSRNVSSEAFVGTSQRD